MNVTLIQIIPGINLVVLCKALTDSVAMDNINDYMIVPPHLNAEAYRNDTSGNGIVSYLDYIKIHPDGTALVGSSEITGRYWDGGANVFRNIADGKTIQAYEKRGINLNSGTADGCFVGNSNQVIICEDSGALSIWCWTKENPWQEWMEEKTVAEHDDGALAIDCLHTGQEYVSVGADGNAKVWDIDNMICIRTYEAHTKPTHAVAVRTDNSKMFATASFDTYVTMWDTNVEVPAANLLKNDCGVRALQWLDDNKLLCGDDAGVLRMLDIRMAVQQKPASIILAEFPAGIHKLTLNASGDKVAVCCDNNIVSVCNMEASSCSVSYHDRHMHHNFVRGMAWDVEKPNVLHTVGWDSVIQSHTIG